MATRDKILQFMKEQAYKPMTEDELIKAFFIKKNEIGLFLSLLDDMEKDGQIVKTRRGRYGVPERMNLVVGRLQGNPKGFAFLIPDDLNFSDVFIPLENLNGAMHNDRVIVRISKKMHNGKSAEGEVIRILERANNTLIGTYEHSRYFGFVVPDDNRIFHDVFIPKDNSKGAKTGQKVVVMIEKWPEKRRNPEGRIIEILGDKDKPGIDILSIIKKHKLPEEFPQEVMLQAEKIKDKVSARDAEGRLDLRNVKMVTIDGEDAKDLDDAVSIEKLSNGNYKLGVHIADVSYYVKEGTPLDREARKRGCSVYLVDRVIPMLPPKLSNGICSLNAGTDRLAMSVIMEFDKNANIVDYEITPSIININERMTYTDVTKILVENDADLLKRYDYLIDDFRIMEELCLKLHQKRVSRGSIDFDFDEAKVILNEEGKPIEIKKVKRTISHRIIEEFMLVCNEVVAEHMFWLNVPFVYRVHEVPDPEKITLLNEFLHNFGYHIKGINDIHPKTLQDILKQVKGKKEERIINMVLLRSLKQARYSEHNLGHFGLAAKFYSHFTSPIRRYPDLVIHRILRETLEGKLTKERQEKLNKMLSNIAKISSERERLAEEAERESLDLKKVEYMTDKIGQEFEGIISGISAFGMFVELDNTIEGLVHVSNMLDDYYHFDEKNYIFRGERTRKMYKIGDDVKVRVLKADVDTRQIDFELVD
ncbi:MAG: ribonuclease [Thermosediminibacterales bacterium]|nr:ribonuclease [Thermosediminibacterales bacterium]